MRPCGSFVLLLAFAPLVLAELPDPAVKASAPSAVYMGTRGFALPDGTPYDAYLGIPYARPPVDELRLEEPQPLEKTPDKVFEAIKEGPECLQLDPIDGQGEITGSEDCLYLNVFTPANKSSDGLPVMVWLHGGLWYFGSGSRKFYGPELLLDKPVILVTLNYRLGPLGFASLEDSTFAGNLGLKDQRMALLWVNENIRGFGGDPDRVTVFGQSAGAASAHFHMMSPLSKGLLSAGISQSGTALSPWALGRRGFVRENTIDLADFLGCRGPADLFACLKSKNGTEILKAVLRFDILTQFLIPFRPVLEPKNYTGAFMNVDPWTTPSDLPWITGFTSSEAAFFFVRITTNGSFVLLRTMDVLWHAIMPKVLMIEDKVSDLKSLQVTTSLRDYYLHNNSISLDDPKPMIDMLTDGWFSSSTLEAANLHKGPVFVYLFDHKSEDINIVKMMGSDRNLGVSHGDDIPYVFKNTKLPVFEKGLDEDREISKMIIDAWTQFAADRNPGIVDWTNWTKQDCQLLHITTNSTKMEKDLFETKLEYWKSLGIYL